MVELGPFIVPPLAPGDVVEFCGAELLPDELSQSFIALFSLLIPLLPLVVPLPLAPGLFEAELPPGPQSFDMLREAPDVEPLVSAPVPDLPLVVPVVPLVCAIAAVPRVSARIEAAVRRRRFIRCPPCEKRRPAGPKSPEALTVNRRPWRHVPDQFLKERPPTPATPIAGSRPSRLPGYRPGNAKKKGRTEARPKFREEKPEGLAVRSEESARTARSE